MMSKASDGQRRGESADKRRSKSDQKGRDYKCTACGKSYLSYPALYTHTRKKHSEIGELGSSKVGIVGRKRGRPPVIA